jgi:hypothetical protein
MRTIQTDIFHYDELSDDAKAKARDWYRNASAGDDFYAECVTDDFHDVLKACGFNVDKKTGLQWSGFWSQGDGAAFRGTWYASDCKPAKLLADRPVSGTRDGVPFECKYNKRWHDAIAPLVELAAQYPHASGSIETSHRYNNMRLESWDMGDDDGEPAYDVSTTDAAAEAFIDAARDLADAFYRTLEAEYEYQNSDEAVAENIICNEYEFTKEGKRI